jgi:hypothetical protein
MPVPFSCTNAVALVAFTLESPQACLLPVSLSIVTWNFVALLTAKSDFLNNKYLHPESASAAFLRCGTAGPGSPAFDQWNVERESQTGIWLPGSHSAVMPLSWNEGLIPFSNAYHMLQWLNKVFELKRFV